MKKDRAIKPNKAGEIKKAKQTTGSCEECELGASEPQTISIFNLDSIMTTTNDKMKNAAIYSGGSIGLVTATVLLAATFWPVTELQQGLIIAIATPIVNTLAVYVKNKLS